MGATMTVGRCWFSSSSDTTTHGRVFLVSLPSMDRGARDTPRRDQSPGWRATSTHRDQLRRRHLLRSASSPRARIRFTRRQGVCPSLFDQRDPRLQLTRATPARITDTRSLCSLSETVRSSHADVATGSFPRRDLIRRFRAWMRRAGSSPSAVGSPSATAARTALAIGLHWSHSEKVRVSLWSPSICTAPLRIASGNVMRPSHA